MSTLRVAPSIVDTNGQGVFANKFFRKGELIAWIALFRPEGMIAHEKDLQTLCEQGNKNALIRHIRLFGDMFSLPKDENANLDEPMCYINHSFNPNVAYIFGFYVALRDIKQDEELLVDYRMLDVDVDSHGNSLTTFTDEKTGVKLQGFAKRAWLRKTIHYIKDLLESF